MRNLGAQRSQGTMNTPWQVPELQVRGETGAKTWTQVHDKMGCQMLEFFVGFAEEFSFIL